MLAAAGMHSPADLKPQHISRRVGDGRILSLADLHPHIEHGALLKGGGIYGDLWANASAERFG
jgi:hypothetical protein